ncbi:hypothetical protein QIT80_gp88 (endogenous virus) [Pseudomonas phage phiAH14a]|uniref:Uncharacterized protein n=1 Tax=Pseudomonas phage phiAH14a TaxID=1805958 RepID=A0A1B0VNE6_9CAUD|nr:hypothetical protein QIT80_gp88 [Pseudomonas phage phiAH14a]AMW64548.1 hypothetical protein AH14a_p88 [Pseudomonas phage phiAH14a]
MIYGARTWSPAAALQLDTDSFTYQVMHNALYQLSAGSVITVPIAGFNPSNCVAVILPTQPAANNYANSAMPFQSVAVGSVTVRSRNPREADNIGSTIQFRLLVMRYKN